MSNSHIYKVLVPDAPLHRRTEKDVLLSIDKEFSRRAYGEKPLNEKKIIPGLQQPSLISSYEGSIDRVLFAFPHYAITNQSLVVAYRSVISELRSGTQFIVIYNRSDNETIEEWFDSAGHPATNITYVALPDYINFTDWAEDAYIALSDAVDSSSYLMEPWEFPRSGDSLIAQAVQEHTDITASQAPLIFQGGNCLIGNNFWLLGKDYFSDSVQLTQNDRPPVAVPDGKTPEEFVRQLFTDYADQDRRLIVLGTKRNISISPYYGTEENGSYYIDIAGGGTGTFQPIFHIDMFVSLIGTNSNGDFEVLVGSPALADQILGTSSPYALNNVYDEFADQLEEEGLIVHRNPLVHQATPGRIFTLEDLYRIATQPGYEALLNAVNELIVLGANDQDPITIRDWHHITWNNCLVENSTTFGKHVYLPTFGHNSNSDLGSIDQHMKNIWEGFGFTTHMLGDFNKFAQRQGVVHCIKKYLNRGV